eukprot:263946_1
MEQYNHDIRMLNYVYGICRNPTTQLLPIIITYCLAANFFVTIQRYCLENADFRHSKGFRDSTKAPATYFIGLNNFKWIDLTNLKGNNIRQHNKQSGIRKWLNQEINNFFLDLRLNMLKMDRIKHIPLIKCWDCISGYEFMTCSIMVL